MKTIVLALIMMIATPALSSHFFSCNLEAKVTKIANLSRLDGTAVFRKDMDDFEQIATIEVTAITDSGHMGHHGCPQIGHTVDLVVKADQFKNYNEGDELNLSYTNIGDRLGSSISWIVE